MKLWKGVWLITKTPFFLYLIYLFAKHGMKERELLGIESYRSLIYPETDETLKHKKSLSKTEAFWWAMRDSNPRPPRCKRGALNQLS